MDVRSTRASHSDPGNTSGQPHVTVIELLRPADKMTADGRDRYARWRTDCLNADANLVEIDLIRAGASSLTIPFALIPAEHRRPYRVCVCRPPRRHEIEFYPASLRNRLPYLAIPLRSTDSDVVLNLQAVIERCYVNGRYAIIDYRKEAEPALAAEDAVGPTNCCEPRAYVIERRMLWRSVSWHHHFPA